jgi:hypothetical protein
MQILLRYCRRRCLFIERLRAVGGHADGKVHAAISIAGRYYEMGDTGDVECEPGARHDDDSCGIAGGSGVSPDFAPIEFAPEFDAGMSRLAKGRD